MAEDRVGCRTPAAGRDGVTSIPRWKFDAVRAAILDAIRAVGPEGLRFADLSSEVRARLDAATLERLGSVGWHATMVKLELEVRGEIRRRPGTGPQRLVLA